MKQFFGMYGLGMSLRDISVHLEDMYGTSISHTVLSEITDRIIPKVKTWQASGTSQASTVDLKFNFVKLLKKYCFDFGFLTVSDVRFVRRFL